MIESLFPEDSKEPMGPDEILSCVAELEQCMQAMVLCNEDAINICFTFVLCVCQNISQRDPPVKEFLRDEMKILFENVLNQYE